MYARIFHGMMFSIQCSGIFTVPIDAADNGKKGEKTKWIIIDLAQGAFRESLESSQCLMFI